jgi:glycyl-tRNA synthetase
LSYFDELTNKRFIPYVIESSVGLGRLIMAVLINSYDEDEINGEKRVVLRLNPKVAPVKVAVLPLSKKPDLSNLAKQVFDQLATNSDWSIEYDETQSIGRRYRRQDEIGTPYCVTVDFESLNDQSVTIRQRDDTKQVRVKINELADNIKI